MVREECLSDNIKEEKSRASEVVDINMKEAEKSLEHESLIRVERVTAKENE